MNYYLDATYFSLRGDQVVKESVHVIVGINDERVKEVLDYRSFPIELS